MTPRLVLPFVNSPEMTVLGYEMFAIVITILLIESTYSYQFASLRQRSTKNRHNTHTSSQRRNKKNANTGSFIP
jgi:hypothetical protein